MGKRITIIQGHPDPRGNRYGHVLAQAYRDGAVEQGHEVRVVNVAQLDFPLLRTQEDWGRGSLPAGLQAAQQAILWAEHLVVFFPLWLGTMPALLKGFFEQVLRLNSTAADTSKAAQAVLAGHSGRVVVTMAMPALKYRWVYFAHGVRGLERSVLGFVGVRPIRETLIGLVEEPGERHLRWLERLRELGRSAD
jgi:putative NADPH-quinone reductase